MSRRKSPPSFTIDNDDCPFYLATKDLEKDDQLGLETYHCSREGNPSKNSLCRECYCPLIHGPEFK